MRGELHRLRRRLYVRFLMALTLALASLSTVLLATSTRAEASASLSGTGTGTSQSVTLSPGLHRFLITFSNNSIGGTAAQFELSVVASGGGAVQSGGGTSTELALTNETAETDAQSQFIHVTQAGDFAVQVNAEASASWWVGVSAIPRPTTYSNEFTGSGQGKNDRGPVLFGAGSYTIAFTSTGGWIDPHVSATNGADVQIPQPARAVSIQRTLRSGEWLFDPWSSDPDTQWAFDVIRNPAFPTGGRIVDFRHPKPVYSMTTARRRLRGTSASFKRYAARQGARLRAEGMRLCGETTGGDVVRRYQTRGYAFGFVQECGGAAAVWAHTARGWRQILGYQDYPGRVCSVLIKHGVPASLFGRSPTCWNAKLGILVPYHHS